MNKIHHPSHLNGRYLLLPQRQFEILEVLHEHIPQQPSMLAKKSGISPNGVYVHAKRMMLYGWMDITMYNSKWSPKRLVPTYTISARGLNALEYGRLEREDTLNQSGGHT